MRKKSLVLVIGLLVVLLPLVAKGQTAGALNTPLKARMLLVDETKTFASTMRVGALAGILRKTCLLYTSPSPRDS